jgi:flavin-dependent dehydrogenase
VQCAADLAKRGRRADVVERREEDGDRNMEEGELSCLARAMLKPLLRPGVGMHEVLAWVHKSENDTVEEDLVAALQYASQNTSL